ncbi:hypothetical protein FJ418_20665 [Mesorhizobium sp. B2-8-3]|nr:hypothetical protein FJ418_20665 [Mesorhizobium sp. B2-8-3]
MAALPLSSFRFPFLGEGGRAKLGRMRSVPAWRYRLLSRGRAALTGASFLPATVSALRADPPSPTRGPTRGRRRRRNTFSLDPH